MRLIATGMPLLKVAQTLGYSPNRLWQITHSPLWEREMAKLQNKLDTDAYDAMAELRRLQPTAVQTYKDLLEQTTYPSLRQMVAKDVFDRTGVRAPTESCSVTATQSYEQQLAQVRIKYEQTGTPENYIEVLGGEELAREPEEDD